MDKNIITITDENYASVSLIGTVHVSKTSKERVINSINNLKPDIVSIELDTKRLRKLYDKNADFVTGKQSSSSLFVKLLKKQQKSLLNHDELLKSGNADMMPAINTAKDNKCKIALIDVSIKELKDDIKSNMYENGKINLELINQSSDEVLDNLKKLLSHQKEINKFIDYKNSKKGIVDYIELMEQRPPNEIQDNFEPLKNILPEVYTAFITERDKNMAGQIHWLRRNNNSVVSVMGKGHLNGVKYYLENIDKLPDKYIKEPEWYQYHKINIK